MASPDEVIAQYGADALRLHVLRYPVHGAGQQLRLIGGRLLGEIGQRLAGGLLVHDQAVYPL